MANSKTIKGFVSREETKELRKKLKSLLSKEDAIAIEPDRFAAKRISKTKRRFTKAEAEFANNLYESYLLWKKRQEKKENGKKS
jgi:hypothetical protein